MDKLYSYYCDSCQESLDIWSDHTLQYIACSCGNDARIQYKLNIAGNSRESFNSHYDEQLGKWFESAEHKKKYMSDVGYQQDGTDSPRKTTSTRFICTKEQALKEFGTPAITRKKGDKYVRR